MPAAVDKKKPPVMLIPSPFQRRAPVVKQSQSLTVPIVEEANTEAVRWLSDVVFGVEYKFWAVRGMTIQNFLRTRQLACQDLFEDITDADKIGTMQGAGEVGLEDLRAQEEYKEIKAALLASAVEQSTKAESGEQWAKGRAGEKARKYIERALRTLKPENARDAMRAAATVAEMETPKASRVPPVKKLIAFPKEAADTVAAAFAEAGIKIVGRPSDGETPAD